MLLKTEGGLQPGHRPQKRIGRNRSCVVGCLKHTPLFYRKDFLPGIDFGLVSRFRAWSVFGRRGEKSGFLRLFPNDSGARVWRRPRFEIRVDNGRFRESEVSCQTTLASRGRVAKTSLFSRTFAVS